MVCIHLWMANCKLRANAIKKIKLDKLGKLDRVHNVLRKSSGTLVFWYYRLKNYIL